jgi:hypothetical protein
MIMKSQRIFGAHLHCSIGRPDICQENKQVELQISFEKILCVVKVIKLVIIRNSKTVLDYPDLI